MIHEIIANVSPIWDSNEQLILKSTSAKMFFKDSLCVIVHRVAVILVSQDERENERNIDK